MDLTEACEKKLIELMAEKRQVSQCTECEETPVISTRPGSLSCFECRRLKCDTCLMQDLLAASKEKSRECEFSDRGCKSVILSTHPHESFCPYSYVCELCDATGHIVKHFETEHKNAIIPSNTFSHYWKVIVGMQKKYWLINGSLFWLTIHMAKGLVTTRVFCVMTKMTDRDFMYTMEYKNGDMHYSFTGDVLDYKYRDNYAEYDENYMNFPAINLPYLYEGGKIKYNFRVRKLKRDEANQGS